MKAGDYSAPDCVRSALGRAGQRLFREQLLQIYKGRRAFCDFGITDSLIAAHIVPYAIDSKNRLNPKNGLLLCRNCDFAFENWYVWLTKEYEIMKSSKLSEKATESAATERWLSSIYTHINHVLDEAAPDANFIEWHSKMARS